MKLRRSAGSVLLAALLATLAPARTVALQSDEPTPKTLFKLEFATGIAFGFDKMFINERAGRIRVVEDGRLLERPLATIQTNTSGENGLLGIAVPPDAGDRAVYVFATDPSGTTNDVWRVPVDGGAPKVVVPDLPAGGYHNGGGVAFDSDGMLLVSNGENHESERSQDISVLGGKVYRFTPDGDVPEDNPWPGSPALSIGHRNPYGLAVDPVTGIAWTTENGPSGFDEINRVEAGSNLGWPVLSGPGCDAEPKLERCADPVLAYESVIVPTGITFAPPSAAESVAGHLFFGAYGVSAIHEVSLDEDRRTARSDEILVDGDEPIVAVQGGPQGLYYSTTTAVKLIPYAQEDPGAGSSPSARPGPSPSPSPGASDDGGATTGFALVVVILLALYAASRRRLGAK